jgi:hypothetical protein
MAIHSLEYTTSDGQKTIVEYKMFGRMADVHNYYDAQTKKEIDVQPDDLIQFIEDNHNTDIHD